VGKQPRTDTQTRVTTIHFLSSTTHAKCNTNVNVYGTVSMTAVFERVQLVQMINTDSDLGVHSASDQAKQLGRE